MNKAITFLKLALASGLVFGLFFGIGAGITSVFTQVDTSEIETEEDGTIIKQDGNRTNILVLGVDARPGEKESRSDTMMLVSVDPKLDKAAIISIPRDTKVDMKGTRYDKICIANVVGGPSYAVKTVEELMQTKIDYYVHLDFNGFKDVIDTLGGVTVTVPERMYKPSEDIDLYPGTRKLNGRDALAFVRYRDYINGDIDRTAMQQDFMKALAGELLQAKTITKLPKLVSQVNKYVSTNMGVADMLRMVSWAPGFTADSITTQTLPGSFYDVRDENGVLINSYWVADKSSLNNLIDDMLAGKTIAVIQGVVEESIPGSKNKQDEDKDLDDKDNKNIDRSKLPSPGHGDGPSSSISGYIQENKKTESDKKDTELPIIENNEPDGKQISTPTNPSGPEGYI
ncbi:MAG TPA: LCP family protein [Syntrophomonadaceae bacterium]|nr:LCP family protein [Syntrophomonadaceae bacterium]